MDLENRIAILSQLGRFMTSGDPDWAAARQRAHAANPWFVPAFTDTAIRNISGNYLHSDLLTAWTAPYGFDHPPAAVKNVGIVMAGNIPLVGFHDFLSVFISGHRQTIKYSTKDAQLLPALIAHMHDRYPETRELVKTAPLLKGCDAFIATGSDNTARYFEYYFGRYPSLIRRNRTSVAVLDGTETRRELEKLADDVCEYFGLGCRSVTQVIVPREYDFVSLLDALRRYDWFADHHRYKNNYDYQLSVAILNKSLYMTNESILLLESGSPFSPIGTLHYRFSADPEDDILSMASRLQCVAGHGFLPFGAAQSPVLTDYADGADTLQFLQGLAGNGSH